MKKLGLIVATSLALSSTLAIAAPQQMTETEMSRVVAGYALETTYYVTLGSMSGRGQMYTLTTTYQASPYDTCYTFTRKECTSNTTLTGSYYFQSKGNTFNSSTKGF